MYDLTCNRPAYTADLQWIRVPNLESSSPGARNLTTRPPRPLIKIARIRHKGTTPGPLKRVELSSERSPRQQSETGDRILTTVTSHSPTPPEGVTFRHLSKGNSTPTPLIFPHEKREPTSLSGGFSLRIRALPLGEEEVWIVEG
ncbi:hypothetical protein AVEN_111721-1 [Araneus ventricosus]|uniref:Uncharacterized protein n=1 Tax=Araneus ventricosus TaxID=182803 RepID=A0A4Y2C8K5_ARAVE|nr:hypothetical protein AVEN_111721-1 [Araneus ventricosus]